MTSDTQSLRSSADKSLHEVTYQHGYKCCGIYTRHERCPHAPDSDLVRVDAAFLATLSNKIGHGNTLGRPFQGFRVPTKIPHGSGCRI